LINHIVIRFDNFAIVKPPDCHPNTQESDLIMPAVVTQAILTSKGVTAHAKEKSGHLPS
jgi:hypothetical protein